MSALMLPNQSSRTSGSAVVDFPQTDALNVEEPEHFNRDELRQFADDDREAGRRIGMILTTLFIYTVVAMTVVVWWSLRTVGR